MSIVSCRQSDGVWFTVPQGRPSVIQGCGIAYVLSAWCHSSKASSHHIPNPATLWPWPTSRSATNAKRTHKSPGNRTISNLILPCEALDCLENRTCAVPV
jgi:hypothetical protein